MRVLDPRGSNFSRHKIEQASRKSLADLKKSKVLLYDNEKLSVKNYEVILPHLRDKLQADSFGDVVGYKEGLRGKSKADIEALANHFIHLNIDAAILALADVGITPLMIHLAIILEGKGIPTICLTAMPGHLVARSIVHYQAGDLPLVPLEIYPGKESELVRNEIDKVYPAILAGISSEQIPTNLEKYPVDQDMENHGDFDIPVNGSLAEQQEKIFEYFDSRRLGDGFPFIAPTEASLKEMLACSRLNADEVLLKNIGPTGADITVRDVLVNSIMAGCKPEYVPVLFAVFQALADPAYNIDQAVTTSHSGGNTVVVSGPIVNKLQISGRGGCLGPGFQANATIGRAINLVFLNVCRALPGLSDLTCLSSSGRFSSCLGEDADLAVWTTINEDYFDKETSTVAVFKADPFRNIMDLNSSTGEQLLETIIDSSTNLGCNNAYLPGNIIYVLTPDHARILVEAGYSKQDLKELIYKRTVVSAKKIKGRGIVAARNEEVSEEYLRVSNDSSEIEIIVAGGRGGHSGVFLPWGLNSKLIIKKIEETL